METNIIQVLNRLATALEKPLITDIIMVLITSVYVAATIIMCRSNLRALTETRNQVIAQESEIALQKEQLVIAKSLDDKKRLQHNVIIAMICASHKHPQCNGEKKNYYVSVSEIHEQLVEMNYLKVDEKTNEDIFYACLDLHSQGEVYIQPNDGVPVNAWKFTKKALK